MQTSKASEIRSYLLSGGLTVVEIAGLMGTSERYVRAVRSRLLDADTPNDIRVSLSRILERLRSLEWRLQKMEQAVYSDDPSSKRLV